jgi:hypothetical protein
MNSSSQARSPQVPHQTILSYKQSAEETGAATEFVAGILL